MIRRIVGLHYSPLGGTAKITERIAREIAEELDRVTAEDISCSCCDMLDIMNGIVEAPHFDEETIAVIGMPVRVGKIPLPAIKLLRQISGQGAMTVALVSYGTPTYGNALYELYNYADELGFTVVGAGAFVAVHGRKLDLKRPDLSDVEAMEEFGRAVSRKLARLHGSDIEGLRIKPAPLMLSGKMPVHRISKVSPKAAAIAELTFEKTNLRRREPEWFL